MSDEPEADSPAQPARRLKRQSTDNYSLPESRTHYSVSFMHRDTVTHALITTAAVVTASLDGVVKFWVQSDNRNDALSTAAFTKASEGLHLQRLFKAHSAPLVAMNMSKSGSFMATASIDQTVKVFDVSSYDLLNVVRLEGIPETAVIMDDPLFYAEPMLLVALRDSSQVSAISALKGETLAEWDFDAPILSMAYNQKNKNVIFIDLNGKITIFKIDWFTSPPSLDEVKFSGRTGLEDLVGKGKPCQVTVSPDGSTFAFFSTDRLVRVFSSETGKIVRRYDESLQFYRTAMTEGRLKWCTTERFEKAMQIEAELEKSPYFSMQTVQFDSSGSLIIFPSSFGIKTIDLESNRPVATFGRNDSVRFISPSLWQGRGHDSTKVTLDLLASNNPAIENSVIHNQTILLTTGMRQARFFMFTNTVVDEKELSIRDVQNEEMESRKSTQPTQDNISASKAAKSAVIRTTKGDIHIDLFPHLTPRAVENFATHARNGYYDNLLFHRIIRGFMVQTGDPNGDGTGGESIWGAPFKDEFHPDLRHDRPFTVSMANAGPNTNGSQFFITTIKCPWLDRKHTVFGRVSKGEDTVLAIEAVETDRLDRPKQDVKILSVEII